MDKFDLRMWKTTLERILNNGAFNAESLSFDYGKLNQDLIHLSKTFNDNSIVFSVHAHIWGAIFPVLKFGSREQVEKNIRSLISGKEVGALVYTDDKKNPLMYIKNHDGTYKLDGKKRFITNAPIADQFVVYARNVDNQMTAFLIPKTTKGMTLLENKKLVGLNKSPICDISFDNCNILQSNILGNKEGNGSFVFNSCIEKERLFIMSSLLGRMHFFKDVFLKLAVENKILDHYPNQATLAELENAIYISSSILNDAASTLQNGESVFLKATQVKIIVSTLYQEVIRSMIQSLGAIGLETNLGFSDELQDSIAASLYSGSNEILKKIIARSVKQ